MGSCCIIKESDRREAPIMMLALKICLVNVMVLTTNARHAKILSLIEKMKQRLPASGSVADDCPGMICPGDHCCPDDSLICCDEDSAYICDEDADDCNNPDPRTKKNPLLMKMRRQDLHAAKAPANGHAKKRLWARTVGKKNLL